MDYYLWTKDTSTLNYGGTFDQTWDVPTDVEQRTMLCISSGICVIGTVSNILSLTFFFFNWSNRLGDKLLVLLNILDLFVCLSDTIYLIFRKSYLEEYPNLRSLFKDLYLTSMECTGFVTTLLTVVRSVATYFTFYKVKQRNIAKSFIAYMLYAAVKAVVCRKFIYETAFNIMLLTTLLMNILVVSVSNLLTIRKLLVSDTKAFSSSVSASADANKHATVTILVLSCCFCSLNLLYSVALFNFVLGHETVTSMLRNTVVYSSIPLNSALNPFVYFIRKREMRSFLSRNIKRWFSGRGPRIVIQPKSSAPSTSATSKV